MNTISRILFFTLGVSGPLCSQVHPVIIDNCTKCHGGVKQKGGLDLRTLESAIEGGDTDTALIPGAPDKSPLFQSIQVGSDPHMPPKKQLTPEEINALRDWISTAKLTPPKELVLPGSKLPTSQVVDQLVARKWQQENVTPAKTTDDPTFARRIYLDLLGRIPKPDELQAFLANPDRNKLINSLTETEEHAAHLTEIFNVVFLDRAKNRGDRKAWLGYLHWVFESNRPWDQVGRDLIIARPKSKEEKGASRFLYEQRDSHHDMAIRTSRTLLGKQVQCAQCHDHPVAPEIEQGHYWGLIAFFSRSLNVKTPEGHRVAERAHGGYDQFANLEGKTSQSQLILFSDKEVTEPHEKREKDSKDFYKIAPPDQWFRKLKKDEKLKKDLPNLPTPKFSRREALAKALTTDNPDYSRAIVNRIWALLFGRGLVHPVDLMDSAHPASHPELLAWLARDFAANGHNIERLIRQLTKSQTYQLDSRPADPSQNSPQDKFFTRALDKPLSAEALARSLRIALGHGSANDEGLRSRLAKVFPDLFEENFSPSVQQTMFLTNGDYFDKLIAGSPLIKRLQIIESPQALVHDIFQTALSRPPDPAELEHSISFVKPKDKSSIQQFVWALLTSAEFRINH